MKKSFIVLASGVLLSLLAFRVLTSITYGLTEIDESIVQIENFGDSNEIIEEVRYGANTQSDNCTSWAIMSAYNCAAKKLASKDSRVVTYIWEDRQGWGRVGTVLQLDSGYIMVRAASNNDNDSVMVGFLKGQFDIPNSRILDGYRLPLGVLR